MRDGPLLLRFAPQRKGDGAPAEHLILPFASEDVLELDVTEKCLRFGDEIVDRLTTVTAALSENRLLDRGCRLAWSGMLCIDQRRPHFISGAAGYRMSSKEQGRQYEHNQRSPVSGRCVHATDSTDEPVRRRRTRIKKFDVVEENPLAIGSDIHCCRHADTCDFTSLSTCRCRHHAEHLPQGVSRPFDAICRTPFGLTRGIFVLRAMWKKDRSILGI